MKIAKTGRGFEIIHFEDRYGKECTLQQSSLADFEPPGSTAIWFGVDPNRMHIDLKQLKEILPHLQAWLETGSFDTRKKKPKPCPLCGGYLDEHGIAHYKR